MASPTSHNVPQIEMDARKYRAASQVADGVMTNAAIAKQAGVERRQLTRWKHEPAFAALVQGLIGEASESIKDEAVATKAGRLRILADLHNKLLQVVEARAAAAVRMQEQEILRAEAAERHRAKLQAKVEAPGEDPRELDDESLDLLVTPRELWAAGEDTGLIVTKETWGKVNSKEAAIDAAVFKQILDLQERIAREQGQWDFGRVDVKHSGRVDHVVRIPPQLHHLTDDELDALERIALKATAAEQVVS